MSEQGVDAATAGGIPRFRYGAAPANAIEARRQDRRAVGGAAAAGEIPRFRYGAALANEIEARWQDRWEVDGTYHAPNPTGPLSEGFAPGRPKLFVLDLPR